MNYDNIQRLEQQQRLQQRLNPQNVALGRLLEMSVPEFEDEVRRELDDNPALEAVENHASEAEDTDFGESAEQLQRADYADPDDTPDYLSNHGNGYTKTVEAASFAADEGESMGELLMRRLAAEHDLNDAEARIAAHIIGNIDDSGYLTRPLAAIADDIAISEGYEPDLDDVRRIFDAVRALDPAGICAVDLRDCLLLQLDRKPTSVAVRTACEIVARYFDMFSKKHFDRLQSALGISREDLDDALTVIRSLNPKPASALETGRGVDRAQQVSPDFILDYDADTELFTLQLQGNIPELAVETTFDAAADAPVGKRDRDARAFIRRKRDDARNFIRLVEQRRNTLLDIGGAILRLQKDFFIGGDRSLIRPMILRDVQELTGLDLSVISRATSGKYILTPHGQYPLKMFFNERPDADTDVSTHRILAALQEIIDGEDKQHPLSDRELTDALNEAGYGVARRTVAKYRERLGAPVARLRRE